MRTIRSKFVHLFVFLIATSILLDWSDHCHKNVLDKFEEVSLVGRGETKEFSLFKGIVKNKDTELSIPSPAIRIANEQSLQYFITFTCKIKSYLHLLQLF
ncbi:hypothetical protein NAT47_08090 [Flavobacterium sp. HXWNR69]|uniref:Uncharacterized protein n=1 Tax=Flavobacterium fragile TaxID=2949085 RepID=A0ABT0THB9_9FLAO|nr:hypothetical protein [Flavobacterium sp. HXWNR69]MCL9770376.1 hypothetical protein [Flavobacterium sp. HXWNR69]